MPVERWGDGGLTITGDSIGIHQLIVTRVALKLEKLGMKHSRGSVRALVRKMDGCPKTMDFDKLIAFLTSKIEGVTI